MDSQAIAPSSLTNNPTPPPSPPHSPPRSPHPSPPHSPPPSPPQAPPPSPPHSPPPSPPQAPPRSPQPRRSYRLALKSSARKAQFNKWIRDNFGEMGLLGPRDDEEIIIIDADEDESDED